ncbi:MAG: hypothetical protein ACI9MC_001714, partial [Kiritimatiellia bacterium]
MKWAIALLTLFACDGDTYPDLDYTDPVQTDETDAPFVLQGAECAPYVLKSGTEPADGACFNAQVIQGGRTASVRADCTDANITAYLSKRHLIMVPDTPSKEVLWLHLGGSGGQPGNTTWIGKAAMSQGYRYISLAYPNVPSIGERCSCEEGPRPPECGELVRLESLYGAERTPWFEMEPDEAIVPRLFALLGYLQVQQPEKGWEAYMNGHGGIRWDRIALSGFSQGGGMAGLIARDNAVNRTMYLSSGGDSALAPLVDPALYQTCETDEDCDIGSCCGMSDLRCETPPPQDAFCTYVLPAPWTTHGQDVDGDGLGDGDTSTRATASARQFGLVHRDEGAWMFSPEVFSSWGMGARGDFIDADVHRGPYPGERLFN